MLARIGPLARAAAKLRLAEASLDLLQRWGTSSTSWLLIDGPMSPEAGRVLEAFGLFLSRCDGDARLLILGAPVETGAVSSEATGSFAGHVERVDSSDAASRKAALLSVDALVLCRAHDIALEAMAIGTPIIGCATPGAIELIGRNGLLWNEKPLLSELIAVSMQRVREDATLRVALRERGFDCLEQRAEFAPHGDA